MGPITKIVGGAIGLTKEYQANRCEQRSRSTSPLPPTINTPDTEHDEGHEMTENLSDYDEDPPTDHDEQQWELDEAQHEIATTHPADDALTGDSGRDSKTSSPRTSKSTPNSPPTPKSAVSPPLSSSPSAAHK
jgi:hypothetical protein